VVPSDGDIEDKLNDLARTDSIMGAKAELRVHEYRIRTGVTDEVYVFPTYKSADERKVWVHGWWVRPLRFFYRHLPRGLRSRIKKAAT